jgi:hypothetical protein
MPFTRRTVLTAAGLSALGAAGLASIAACQRGDGMRGKSEEMIRRDREFDWRVWLGEWDRDARLAVARMLLRFGVAGPDGEWFGSKDYIRKLAREAGYSVSEELLSPLQSTGTLDLDVADRLMKDARERIAELSRYADLSAVSYDWQVIKNNGVAFPPATELDAVQTQLGLQLPHAFREFLRVSNGWISVLVRLLPMEQVGRFVQKDPESVAIWSDARDDLSDREYFVYGKEQSTVHYRGRYLPDCLLISGPGLEQGTRLLLNPAVKFEDGEWETWYLAPYLPGASRYQSFIEVVERLRREDTQHFRWLTGEMKPVRRPP